MTDTTVIDTGGDALSPAEAEYLSSRGEKTEGLAQEPQKPADVGAKPEAKPEIKVEAKAGEETKPDESEVELGTDGKPKNPGRFVNHGAFHAERERRKAAEAKANEFVEKFSRVDERLRLLSEAMAKPQQEQPQEPAKPPDPEKDIFGYMKWQAEQIKALSDEVKGTGKKVETTNAETSLRNAYVSDVQAYAAKPENSDFGAAYNFLMQGRNAELEASGIDDPAERMRIIVDEEKWLVGKALNSKASPAERLYKLATARGYKKAEAPPPTNAQPQNGQQAPANGAAEKIANIQRGQEASKTLSAAGGSPTDVMTAEALANMSEDEFAAWMAKTPKHVQRQLMGG